MTTTWNASDKTNITLSGGNLTATNAGAVAGGVRSTSSHAIGGGGKYYFEFTGITMSSSNAGLGMANATWTLTGTSNSNNIISHVTFGAVRDGNGGSLSLSDGSPSGHTLSIAVDFTLNKVWWRIDGNGWNNAVIGSQDPANGIGGQALAGPAFPSTTAMFIAAALVAGSEAATLNVGATAFTQSVPSGFVGWDATPPPYTQSTAVVMS